MVASVVNAGINSDDIDVWFQDEARVGQRGTQTRIWASTGTRPRVVRQQQFLSAYIYGAVCPKTGQSSALILPDSNTESMQLHLKEISNHIPEGRHGVIIMDRASWHTTKAIDCFDNLSLIFLPPYSPELNPVEQVWQWLRDHDLANKCFKGYDDILLSATKAWNNFSKSIVRVKSLCSRDWATLGS